MQRRSVHWDGRKPSQSLSSSPSWAKNHTSKLQTSSHFQKFQTSLGWPKKLLNLFKAGMQRNFADRLLHDPKLSESVNVPTPQSLILWQVASARAVITDLLSSSTERTLAMSRIQILWLSNLCKHTSEIYINIYQDNTWRLKHKLHELSRFARSDIEENHSNRMDTGPFAGLTGIFRQKKRYEALNPSPTTLVRKKCPSFTKHVDS